ncbi:unnamed protein product [Amoebophrya sp. A120]|nr:unnamed protein product [Amoebophrya sp. A120]|eukprot:GSA120T00011716001.1
MIDEKETNSIRLEIIMRPLSSGNHVSGAAEQNATIKEWISRKDTHEVDPMLSDSCPLPQDDAEAGPAADNAHYRVTASNCVLADSKRTRFASGRRYFPVADCVRKNFKPSGKRWR